MQVSIGADMVSLTHAQKDVCYVKQAKWYFSILMPINLDLFNAYLVFYFTLF